MCLDGRITRVTNTAGLDTVLADIIHSPRYWDWADTSNKNTVDVCSLGVDRAPASPDGNPRFSPSGKGTALEGWKPCISESPLRPIPAGPGLPIACVTHGSGTRLAFRRFPLNECFKPSPGQNPAGRGPIVSGRHRAHWAPRLKACAFSARSRRIPAVAPVGSRKRGTPHRNHESFGTWD